MSEELDIIKKDLSSEFENDFVVEKFYKKGGCHIFPYVIPLGITTLITPLGSIGGFDGVIATDGDKVVVARAKEGLTGKLKGLGKKWIFSTLEVSSVSDGVLGAKIDLSRKVSGLTNYGLLEVLCTAGLCLIFGKSKRLSGTFGSSFDGDAVVKKLKKI